MVLVFTACASAHVVPDADRDATGLRGAPGNRIISQEQIEKWNAVDALDVVQRGGMGYSVAGSSLRTRRGEGSLLDRSAVVPLVFVDNIQASATMLRNIPAHTIEHIEFVSALNASTRYGVNGGAGAVLVFTKNGEAP